MEKVVESCEKIFKSQQGILKKLEDLEQPKNIVNCTMKSYQITGLRWLASCFSENHSCILADDMGLGKTLQSISFLTFLKEKHDSKGPFLIIAPLSVVENWVNEFEKFSPTIKVVKFIGCKEEREEFQKKQKDFEVLVTSYDMIIRECDYLSKIKWNVLVVDEGHRLKNKNAVLYTTLTEEFKLPFKILLTGTPIQNNIKELFSLIHFINPELFNNEDDFLNTFKDMENKENENIDILQNMLKPFILRRNKKDVLKDLPKKKEYLLYSQLTKMQKKYYIGILKKDANVFNKKASRSLVNVIMSLRKCCNHPYLFQGAEPEPFSEGEHIINNSGKMILLDKLLTKLHKEGHKVLIFSQMTSMLDIVQDYMHLRNYVYERIDGSVRSEERNLAIKNFTQDDIFAFLLSTRAGGVGLNLVKADTVIFIDHDYNPMMDKQAQERVYRIGQTKEVSIFRLIMKNTVEEITLKRAFKKLQLAENIIESGKLSSEEKTIETETLMDIIKFGLHNVMNDENSDEDLLNTDIEKLLGEGEIINQEEEKLEEKIEVKDDMYTFEGTDYKQKKGKKDDEIFLKITDIDTAIAPLPKRLPKIKKVKSDFEEKPKKRKKTTSNYVSNNIILPEDTDESDELFIDELEDVEVPLSFVFGDVTKPHFGKSPKIILNCVSTLGKWGKGGLFSALNKISDLPKKQYEKTKKNKDLSLGDANLVKISDELFVVNVCVQKMEKGFVSGIILESLEETLKKVAFKAKELGASVHLPRIGYGLPNFNWYGVERILKKNLSTLGIPSFVYYYKKNQSPQIQKINSINFETITENMSESDDEEVVDVFEGISIALYDLNDEEKSYKRKVFQNGGIVVQLPTDQVNVIVTSLSSMDDILIKYSDEIPHVRVLKKEWIDACLGEGVLVKDSFYELSRKDRKIESSIDPENYY